MTGWQIGCYTRPWNKHDWPVAFDAIAEAGFKHVGLMTSKTGVVISADRSREYCVRVGEEARKRGMTIPSVYGGGLPVNKSLETGIDALRSLIDNCAAAKAGSLLLAGIDDQKLEERYYKAVAECCDYAAEKKILLTLKPHGGNNATGEQCRKQIEKVEHKMFRMWYDPGNIFYSSNGQIDPAWDSETVGGMVVGMCVKDYRHPKNVLITPGTGQVDFAAVLAHLKTGGFTHGPLIVETLTPGDLPVLLREAKQARIFLEKLTAS